MNKATKCDLPSKSIYSYSLNIQIDRYCWTIWCSKKRKHSLRSNSKMVSSKSFSILLISNCLLQNKKNKQSRKHLGTLDKRGGGSKNYVDLVIKVAVTIQHISVDLMSHSRQFINGRKQSCFLYIRVLSRFFVQVGHETIYASSGKKHSFTR